MNTLVLTSPALKKRTTPSQADRTNALRRAYFASAISHGRWNVDIESVISCVNWKDAKWDSRPEQWIEDVVIACACVRGEQQAWHHIRFVNTWHLREAAELRLNPEHASLLVERFWRELLGNTQERSNSSAKTPRIQEYQGCQTLGRWLLSQILTRTESLPMGATVDSILDTMPRVRTLACEASVSQRVPQAT